MKIFIYQFYSGLSVPRDTILTGWEVVLIKGFEINESFFNSPSTVRYIWFLAKNIRYLNFKTFINLYHVFVIN